VDDAGLGTPDKEQQQVDDHLGVIDTEVHLSPDESHAVPEGGEGLL